jgi:hypothetical protein
MIEMPIDWRVASVGSAAAVVVIATTVGLANHGSARGSVGPTQASPVAIVTIDASVGETFTPLPDPSNEGFLTSSEAWAMWENGDKLPDSIEADFGTLTLLTGPEGASDTQTRESDLPVWAFQEQFCMQPVGGPGSVSESSPTGEPSSDGAESPKGVPTSPKESALLTSCTTWTFLDAKTGEHVDSFSVANP